MSDQPDVSVLTSSTVPEGLHNSEVINVFYSISNFYGCVLYMLASVGNDEISVIELPS